MTTGELAIELRGVVNLFAEAAQALQSGDLSLFKAKYVEANQKLDTFDALKESQSI